MKRLATGDLIDFDKYDVDFKKMKVSEIKELYNEMAEDYDYNAQYYINDFEQVVEWRDAYKEGYLELLDRKSISKNDFYSLLRNIESDLRDKLNIKNNQIIKAVDMALSRFLE